MKKAMGIIVGSIILAFIAFVVWKLKWIILGGSLIITIGAMVYEKVTGKKVAFLNADKKDKE